MNTLSISINGHLGFIFEGDVKDTIAFVPEEAIIFSCDGPTIDQAIFLTSGWAERSMRFSKSTEDCERVFALEDSPIEDIHDPRISALLERLRHVYKVELGPNHNLP